MRRPAEPEWYRWRNWHACLRLWTVENDGMTVNVPTEMRLTGMPRQQARLPCTRS